MKESKRPSWLVIMVVIVLLGAGYVLSYAPIVRVMVFRDPDLSMAIDSQRMPVYKPVDWLIDHTPLYRGLFWWASVWGVRDDFEVMHDVRATYSSDHRYLLER